MNALIRILSLLVLCFAVNAPFLLENAPLGVHAGKAAGLFTVAVTTGPIPREAFVSEKADAIFPSMPEFAEFLKTRPL